jgi:hypothetical protein
MSFQEELVKAAIGPAVTVLLGTVLIGSLAALYRQWDQDRRAAQQLRRDLIDDMTRSAGSLWMQCAVSEREPETRAALTRRYMHSRVQGEVIESRLRSHYDSDTPSRLWHAVMDVLTVRYFVARGSTDDTLKAIRGANEGDKHSGLSVDELQDRDTVERAYKDGLRRASLAVLDEPLRLTGTPVERWLRQRTPRDFAVFVAVALVIVALVIVVLLPWAAALIRQVTEAGSS